VAGAAFRHEAFLYADEGEFVAGTAGFVREGLDADEPVLVVVTADKIRQLREALGVQADAVAFADMDRLGRNPGRLMSAWYEFAGAHVSPGRPARGVGELAFTGRTPDEVVESQRHERLLNLAFDGGAPWMLMCPYDSRALAGAVLDEARHSHPVLRLDGETYANARYRTTDPAELVAAPLTPAPAGADEQPVSRSTLREARDAVRRNARAAGLPEHRADDRVVAVSELVSNTIRHAGGSGVLCSWRTPEAAVHEVRDAGAIRDPLVGRRRVPVDEEGGRGLWLVHQLCDLVEVRSDDSGTIVRVQMRLDAGSRH
jgi:anti-sigma regulatory factor (Ser/Thr protein kinase)